MDSFDLETVKKTLEQYTQDGFLLPDTPLLVFFIPPTNSTSVHLEVIGKEIGLNETRNWSIRKIDFDNLEGIWSGLSWLVQQIDQKN